MLQSKDGLTKIIATLDSMYPDVKTPLVHHNPFQLLIATMLSAQCTDKQVNAVTPSLFKALPGPQDFAAASLRSIEKLVRSTGFFRNKASNIQKCSRELLKRYEGRVPQNLEALVKLPGVGRKTANVVLGAAFGIPGIVVDTHVARVSGRLGLTGNKDPVKIEFDLMEIIPITSWNHFCLQLIFFGREICKARKPLCETCPLYDLSFYAQKAGRRERDREGEAKGA